MSDDTNRVLDLDQLFGQARAVKVKWQGKEYELLRMEAFGPKRAVQIQRLQERAQKLFTGNGSSANGTSDQEAVELESVIDEMLTFLCDDLPTVDIPFSLKLNIVQFYGKETQGKKAMELALKKVKRTGARSSRK